MRISDWSSDVCSSDLAKTLSSLRCLALRHRIRGVQQLFVAEGNDVDGRGRRQSSGVHDGASDRAAEERWHAVADLPIGPDLRLRELDQVGARMEPSRFQGGDDAGPLRMHGNKARTGDVKGKRVVGRVNTGGRR